VDLDRITAGLDEAQREAVLTPAEPLCILAGPGSGKTRVLTRRIARRALDGSADASHVLALTFTRRAAGELVHRLRDLGLRERPTAGTFHAVAYGVLRARWDDQRVRAPDLLTQRQRLVATVVTEAGRGARDVPVAAVSTEIDWARARLVAPDRYEAEARRAGRRPGPRLDTVAELYAAYEAAKRARRVVDFDDLLALCTRELQRDVAFAEVQRWRFRHLFVDEYQDLNPLQHALLEAWRGGRPDLCVVGDPDQAIYGWNGADAGWLHRFADEHPGTTVVRLRSSYRSTPQVLTAAHAVLAASGMAGDAPTAVRPDGALISVHAFGSEEAEATGVARLLRDYRLPGRPWRSFAVLVRTNAQVGVLRRGLEQAGVPCRVRAGASLLDEPAVRGALGEVGDPGATGSLAALADTLETRLAPVTAGDDETPATPAGPSTLRDLAGLAWSLLEDEPAASVDRFRSWLATGGAGDDEPTGDAVDVVTFHAAKGLEWPVVVVAGVERGLVPHAGAGTPEARAEEVRLLYVALTRAEQVLHVTWCRTRNGQARDPSPLLQVLEQHAAPPPVTAPPPHAPRPPRPADPVLERLLAWRRAAARAADLPESAICSDAALAAVAAARPRTVDDLAAVPGFGPLAARRLGPRVLAVLNEAAAP
jgi:DNA helicase-2/ATP-dependent DNA helicase PcrA